MLLALSVQARPWPDVQKLHDAILLKILIVASL